MQAVSKCEDYFTIYAENQSCHINFLHVYLYFVKSSSFISAALSFAADSHKTLGLQRAGNQTDGEG